MHHIKKTEKIHSCLTSKGNFPFFLNFHPSRHGDWLITVQIYASAARAPCLLDLTVQIKHKHKYTRVWRTIHLLKRLKISCCWKNARKQKRGQAQLSGDGTSNVHVTRRLLRTHRGKILLIFTVVLMIMVGIRC